MNFADKKNKTCVGHRMISRWAMVCFLVGFVIHLQSCCACTQKRCSDEVVFVTLIDASGTNFEDCAGMAIRWTTDASSGEVTEYDLRDGGAVFELPGTIDFENGEIIEVGTRDLDIEVYCDDSVVFSTVYELEWKDNVCNKCSDRAWCDDEITSTASVTAELDPSEFPIQ